MQSLSKKTIFFFLTVGVGVGLFLAFNPPAALADASLWNQVQEGGLKNVGTDAYGTNKPSDIRTVVSNVIRTFLGLLGIIFLILLVFAGYKWMTAQGEEEKVREAVSQIKNAVIGLVLVLSAYAISVFVLKAIVYTQTGYTPY